MHLHNTAVTVYWVFFLDFRVGRGAFPVACVVFFTLSFTSSYPFFDGCNLFPMVLVVVLARRRCNICGRLVAAKSLAARSDSDKLLPHVHGDAWWGKVPRSPPTSEH